MRHLIWALAFLSLSASGAVSDRTDSGSSETPIENVLTEDLLSGLRDPFALPTLAIRKDQVRPELTLYSVSDLKLNGVITGPKKLRAMISTPAGKAYFVKVGDAIGLKRGRITEIRNDAVRVVEYEDTPGGRISETVEMRIEGTTLSIRGRGGRE